MDKPATLEATAPIGIQLITDLRRRIVTGQLSPGSRLSEQEIAGTYGLSRQPVREAFIKLSVEKLVEIRPQRGTFVCRIDLNSVAQSQFVREAVEADLARIVAGKADPAWIDQLGAQVAEQARHLNEGAAIFIALDETFHRTLAQAAGKEGVWSHIQPLKMHMDRVRYLTAEELPLDPIVTQHREIVEALRRGDADAAEASIRTHLRVILEDLRKMAHIHPQFFEPIGS